MAIYTCDRCNRMTDEDKNGLYVFRTQIGSERTICQLCVERMEGEREGYECCTCGIVYDDSPGKIDSGLQCQECHANGVRDTYNQLKGLQWE